MAQRKSDDQLLRKVFDAAYAEIDQIQHIDPDAVKDQIKRTTRANRRILSYSLAIIFIAVAVIAVMIALNAYFDYLAWVNRPTFAERIAAPYDLENKLPPYLLNAVTVDAQVDAALTFVTPNITYYPISEQQSASDGLSTVVQLQSIVPATIGDFTLQWDRKQATLLANCLMMTGTEDSGRCQIEPIAEYIEPANFMSPDGNRLGLLMTKFATPEEATSAMNTVYQYARQVGRIGNFSFASTNQVNYFYSATRAGSSFTWSNGNWVISISADKFADIDTFLAVFPLYENNPQLEQIVVEQIPPATPEPVVEEPAAAIAGETAEATSEVTEEVVEPATE